MSKSKMRRNRKGTGSCCEEAAWRFGLVSVEGAFVNFLVGATERHSAEAPSSSPQWSPAHFVVSGSCGKTIQKWDLAPNPGDPPPLPALG